MFGMTNDENCIRDIRLIRGCSRLQMKHVMVSFSDLVRGRDDSPYSKF